MFDNQIEVQSANALDFLTTTNNDKIIDNKTVELSDGNKLYFNENLKITHKQKKQLSSLQFKGTGLKFVDNQPTFENPEQFMENVEIQKETLIILFWNTEQYWRSNCAQGNYWTNRPSENLPSELVEFMFEQIQDKVDPLKTKKLIQKAQNQTNE